MQPATCKIEFYSNGQLPLNPPEKSGQALMGTLKNTQPGTLNFKL